MGVWVGEDMEGRSRVDTFHGKGSSLIVEEMSVKGAGGNWKKLFEQGE